MRNVGAPSRGGPVAGGAGQAVVNLLRGFLIGMAELAPGVSGGTVALVVGIYERLIASAGHVVNAALRFVTGPQRVGSGLRGLGRANWQVIVPVLLAMATAVFTMSAVMHGFVEGHPVHARALFLGMVLASILVPLSMLSGSTPHSFRLGLADAVVVAAVAAGVFVLLGVPGFRVSEPTWWIIVVSGAVAVCALVLPGLSGSFILLTFGMYSPTLDAVSDRSFDYLNLFALGAVAGFSTFVKALNHLFRVWRRATLLVMTAMMLGSLRALWPWQTGGDQLLLPAGDWLPVSALFVLGAGVVIALWFYQRRHTPRSPAGATMKHTGSRGGRDEK